MEQGGINRKTIGVGFIIALLFVGGGIYAWDGSVLKGSIGGAVQPIGIDKIPQKLIQNQIIGTSGRGQDGKTASTTLRRTTSGIVRNQNTVLGKESIQVVRPNGGEKYCLGDTIDVAWKYKGVQTIRVLLQGKHKIYDFGEISAKGAEFQPKIFASKEGLYKIVLINPKTGIVWDESKDYFAIKYCKE